ncbi:translocation/assembly module TamB domain-containing protein [soil metagenome]
MIVIFNHSFIQRVLFSIVTLILVSISLALFFIATNPGLKLLIAMSDYYLPGTLHVVKIEGTLWGPISLQKIHYQIPGIIIDAETVELQWQPLKLLSQGQVVIDSLQAEKFHFNKDKEITLVIEHTKLTGLAYHAGDIILHDGLFETQDASLHISGDYTKKWHVHWQLNIPHLNKVVTAASGILISQGQIQGAITTPHVQGSLLAKQIQFSDNKIANLKADFDIHLIPEKFSHVQLTGERITITKQNFDKFNVDLQGTAQKHNLDFTLNGPIAKVKLLLQGSLLEKNWRGAIKQLQINVMQYGNWHLRQTTTVSIIKNDIALNPLCLVSGKQELCAQAKWDKQALWSKINFVIPSQGYAIAEIRLPNYSVFTAPKLQQSLQGQAQMEWRNLNFLAEKIPTLQHPQGHIKLNSQIAGTLAKPLLKGAATLVNGSVAVADLGLKLTSIQLLAEAQQLTAVKLSGSAQSGGGTLNFSGNVDLQQAGLPLLLTLRANNLQVSNTPEYQVYASFPDVKLQLKQQQLAISGKIFIPKAQIQPKSLSAKAETLSSDVEWVTPKDKTALSSNIMFSTQINLLLGKQVSINAMGLRSRISGELLINNSPKKIMTGVGELSIVNGTYQAYGQDLKIRLGRLLFTGGAIDNPALNIQAVRTVNVVASTLQPQADATTNIPLNFSQNGATIVGVNVSGTLKQHQMALFSEPANLSQTDILSYLMLGKASSELSLTDAQLLLQASSALNLGGSKITQVMQHLQQSLGLQQLGLQSETLTKPNTNDPTKPTVTTNTAFVIGKQLTKQLYLSYSIGILDPISTFKLRYQLSKHWSVQSESNSLMNGIDLFYSLEK